MTRRQACDLCNSVLCCLDMTNIGSSKDKKVTSVGGKHVELLIVDI